jgi:hypothetical protein
MSIQHIQLRGERYVILPEEEFLELQRHRPESEAAQPSASRSSAHAFHEVVPLKVGGVPASELLIRDRR